MSTTAEKIEARRARAASKSQLEATVQVLERFDRDLARSFRREIRQATKAPKATAQAKYPLFVMSGWQTNGVRGWNRAKPARGVYIEYAKLPKDPARWTRLVLAWIGQKNPVGMMYETAGSKNAVRYRGRSRWYAYKGGRRSHALNGQGKSFIENMGGPPYRVIDPVARQYSPVVARSLAQTAERLEAETSRALGRKVR